MISLQGCCVSAREDGIAGGGGGGGESSPANSHTIDLLGVSAGLGWAVYLRPIPLESSPLLHKQSYER